MGIDRESLDIFGGGGSQILHFCYRYAQHFEIFAGILFWPPVLRFHWLLFFFFSALLFQYCFNTIEYGQTHSLEQLMKPVVVQATNAAHVGHVAL